MTTTTYANTPTKTVVVGDATFSYRELGGGTGVPVIFLNHLAAVLDNWDPRVVDGIATTHHVVAFDNRGVGASSGKTPDTVAAMARDAIAFIRALGFDRVDLLGFSLGGMIAQEIVTRQPQLVRKLILAGTGPAGGVGIDKVTRVTIGDTVTALLTGKDPKENLFFTRTAHGKSEAKKFVARLKERTSPVDLSGIRQPVFVANGDDDRMVPTSNSHDLARQLPNAQLKIYPDAGHGGIFQFHDEFVGEALAFLV
ncbi:alpha/beta hydrolase [Mycolicibacterium sp. P1-18]|uniref:alpha/beta fold hydrolase n=1 Tax=Mycolicibacterium sp. P1-18 TaxID=2024615 RepID=UPI0011F3C151|nr:alpha/beta hydrolase [Mycolicibacterium sp. P1-18]KAA0094749.1 alpha/beta hydrolase [Mycolicibacterium sp. P1-18]